MRCEIADDDLPAFVTYLALGTPEAIRARMAPAEVGIWTLGRPLMWEPLEKASLVPQVVIDVLQTSDELSAIQKLAPETFDITMSDLIERLHAVLEGMPNLTWRIEWT